MKHQFTAIIERGERYLIATSPEVPEAHGQGLTREECLSDLADSIQSVLEHRCEDTKWESRFATDAKAGKLDKHGEAADRALKQGKCRPL